MSGGAPAVPELTIDAGGLAAAVDARLGAWQAEGVPARLWRKDTGLWSERPLAELDDRLGWLDLPAAMPARLGELESFAGEAAAAGLDRVVLVGMGGSSLGAEMLQAALGDPRRLRVADSTHPDAVAALAAELDPGRVLFVVSSKSGTTVETDSLMRFFWHWLAERVERPGERFVAITDPGSRLAVAAGERRFRRLFEAPADVGGRYSVLGPFGLVPAALGGLAVAPLLESAAAMAAACGPGVAVLEHPGLRLAALLGEAAMAGRPALRLGAAPGVAAFVPWVEQLVAESTGKQGRGILPLPAAPAAAAGPAACALTVELGGDEGGEPPRARIAIGDAVELGGEVFRWQVAVAMASAVLGVHPFDQPDVQLAKELARRAISGEGGAEAPPVEAAAHEALRRWLDGGPPAAYLAVQAFLASAPALDGPLERLRRALGRRAEAAATLGYGPRFLHSTGQLHKGGLAGGRFLQLVDRPRTELEIPGAGLGFGRLLRAQADGDAGALARRGRDLLRLDLGAAPARTLELLVASLEAG